MSTACREPAPDSVLSAIGRITLDAKPAGERRTGKPSAPFDRAGAGDGRIAYRASPRPYLGESAVECEQCLELLPLALLEIAPPPQQQPPLASEHPAGVAALAEELRPSGLVDRVVDMAEDVELVRDDPGVRQVGPETLREGLPHVDTHGPDGAPLAARQGLGEEAVQGLALPLQPDPERFPPLQVADDGQKLVALAKIDLIDPQVPQGPARARRRPPLQHALVHPADGSRAGNLHFAATRLTGAASQSCATVLSSRVVACALPVTNGNRSVRTPQRRHRTR